MPPFQGGAAGLLGYDLNRSLEAIAPPRFDEFQTPPAAIGFYDVVLAFDHQQDAAWLISQGFPETDPDARRKRAAERLQQFRRWLSEEPSETAAWEPVDPLSIDDIAPQFPTDKREDLTSDFSADGYRDSVQRVIDYILDGDAFQVNLSQRLLTPQTDHSAALYRRLRDRNPATFAGYFDLGDFQIVSASPERFLRLSDNWVETRPIKGTRLRTTLPEADLFSAQALRQSEKDRAENIMIVDLLRNDLSRVCLPESVQVTQLCELESYQFVQHLVSAVRGRLAPEHSPWELLEAAFPGGSITGAPKVRAMEIIAELESTARGPYCGGLGYHSFCGAMDWNLLIRTITAGRGWLQLPVGGGVVAQSSPRSEYEETWSKAAGMLRALR